MAGGRVGGVVRGAIWAAVVALGLLLSGSALLAGANEQDISAPVVVWLTVEPMFVDTSEASQAITITARITDDLSGQSMTETRYQSAVAQGQMLSPSLRERDRISGDANDGVYLAVVILPRYSAYGEWKLSMLFNQDKLGNYAFVQSHGDGIAQRFFNGPPAYLPNTVWLPVVGR